MHSCIWCNPNHNYQMVSDVYANKHWSNIIVNILNLNVILTKATATIFNNMTFCHEISQYEPFHEICITTRVCNWTGFAWDLRQMYEIWEALWYIELNHLHDKVCNSRSQLNLASVKLRHDRYEYIQTLKVRFCYKHPLKNQQWKCHISHTCIFSDDF